AGLGTRAATFSVSIDTSELAASLAERNDALLTAYVADAGIPDAELHEELARQTRQSSVHPVFFGSAITGAGVDALMRGIAELLPAAARDADAPPSGSVFKIERGPAGEKIAYVRMYAGSVRVRDRLRLGDGAERKVTAVAVFDDGPAVARQAIAAGEIGKLWGLPEVRIGDPIGEPHRAVEHHFAPPTLETIVEPRNSTERGALRTALAQLAEQDPLINVRQDDARQELAVSLYGEVQKEVVKATPAGEYGLEVSFRETTTICVERPSGVGEAVERLRADSNPFLAGVGLRV